MRWGFHPLEFCLPQEQFHRPAEFVVGGRQRAQVVLWQGMPSGPVQIRFQEV